MRTISHSKRLLSPNERELYLIIRDFCLVTGEHSIHTSEKTLACAKALHLKECELCCIASEVLSWNKRLPSHKGLELGLIMSEKTPRMCESSLSQLVGALSRSE